MFNPLHAFRRDIPPESGPPVLRQWVTRGLSDNKSVEVRYTWPVAGSSREGAHRFREAYPDGTLLESSRA